MKKNIIIVLLIIGIPSVIFIGDDFFRNNSENPFNVGKKFSYNLMTKDSEGMLQWADPVIYEKINDLKYPPPLIYQDYIRLNDIDLVFSCKIWNTIVCTYAYYYEFGEKLPFLYSAVLKPIGLPSLWEKTKDFIYFEIPFGDKLINTIIHKQRWLVVDFYTDDDFENYYVASQKKYFEFMNQKNGNQLVSSVKREMQESQLFAQRMWNWNHTNEEWGKKEMISQNKEIKKSYADIFDEINNDN